MAAWQASLFQQLQVAWGHFPVKFCHFIFAWLFSCVGWPGERAFIPKGPSEELTGLLELGCPGAGMTSLSATPPLVRPR